MMIKRRLRRHLESECFLQGVRSKGGECPVLGRFKGMSVDDFLGGGFMQGESDDEEGVVSVFETCLPAFSQVSVRIERRRRHGGG